MKQKADSDPDDMEVEVEMDASNDHNNQSRVSYGYNKFVDNPAGLTEEQRCHLPRRFAAGHAEMQPSAFRSTHDTEEEAEDLRSSNKSKSSPLEEEAANGNLVGANMDSSMEAYYDSQRQKRPRRFTKDAATTNHSSGKEAGASNEGDQG